MEYKKYSEYDAISSVSSTDFFLLSTSGLTRKVTCLQLKEYLDAYFGSSLPTQTGHAGEFLTTDGADASWDELPPQTILTGTDNQIAVSNGGVGATTLSFPSLLKIDASYCTINTDTDGSTITFDIAAYNKHRVTLGGNRTLALSGDTDGQTFTIILKQDGTGSRTVTWWSGILWQDGAIPTLTTTAGKYDIFSFTRLESGVYLGAYALNF